MLCLVLAVCFLTKLGLGGTWSALARSERSRRCSVPIPFLECSWPRFETSHILSISEWSVTFRLVGDIPSLVLLMLVSLSGWCVLIFPEEMIPDFNEQACFHYRRHQGISLGRTHSISWKRVVGNLECCISVLSVTSRTSQ